MTAIKSDLKLNHKLDDMNQMEDRRRQRQAMSCNTHHSLRFNPFDTEISEQIDIKTLQISSQTDNGILFTRLAFAEIHEFYGLKFREYIQQNRDKEKTDLLND
jgi:hypothetical protein